MQKTSLGENASTGLHFGASFAHRGSSLAAETSQLDDETSSIQEQFQHGPATSETKHNWLSKFDNYINLKSLIEHTFTIDRHFSRLQTPRQTLQTKDPQKSKFAG